MSGIEWQEPPADARVIGKRSGKLADLARELRANVGRWAIVPDGGQERSAASAAGLAQNIRRAKVKGFEQGVFEAAVLGPDVWARCVDAGIADLAPEPVAPPVAPPVARSARDDDPVPADEPERVPESAEVDAQGRKDHLADVRTRRLSADVRAWAKQNGHELGDVGRIPADVFDAYFKATGIADPRPRIIR